MVLNYNHLYYFHVAAVEGSVAGAAQRLGVRQPTVSEQLRSLEKALARNLFERVPSGLRLTEAGRLVFQHTTRMFHIAERLAERVGLAPEVEPRRLRLGVSVTIARTTKLDFVLPVLLMGDCVPSVQTSDTVELIRELREGELDLVLTEAALSDGMSRGFLMNKLEPTRLVAVAPPSVAPAADWHDVGLARYRATSPYGWEVATFLEANRLVPMTVAESDDALFLLEIATRRACIAIVPLSVARAALTAGRLRVLADVPAPGVALHVVHRDSHTVALTQRAIGLLSDAIRDGGAA